MFIEFPLNKSIQKKNNNNNYEILIMRFYKRKTDVYNIYLSMNC